MTRAVKWLKDADTATKLILGFAGLMALILGVGGKVFASREDVATKAAFDGHVAESDKEHELLFEAKVRTETSLQHLHEEVVGMRVDLRDLERGRRLQPLAKEPRR